MKRPLRHNAPTIAVVLLLAALITAFGIRQASAHYDRKESAHPVVQTGATPAPTQDTSDGNTTGTGSDSEDPNDTEAPGTEANDVPIPAGSVTVTEAQAQATALAANPGTTVAKVELSDENGTIVYSVELSNGADVKVNAQTGAIVGTDQAGSDAGDTEGDSNDAGND